MAITRSQIARQLLAEGGAPNPRKSFRSGDLAARDDSYGTLSGGESPASTGGDNEMVFDQRFQDIVTAPETVGFTRGSDAAEFIKSNLATGLGMIANKPGISTGINILRNIFPDTGQTYVRGVDRFGTGDDSETTRIGNRIVQPMMPMTPKLPSDIEPEQSDMQEFVQRFTLPERFRLSGGGPIRQAYGLGSLVKSITKPVKKVLKSDVGKAALAAAAIYYAPAVFSGTTGFGPGTTYGNFLRGPAKNFLFGTPFNAPDAVTGGATKGGLLNFLKSPRGAATAILGTSALAGAMTPEEEVESLSSRISDRTGIDVEAIRKEVQAAYASGDLSGLKSKYPFLIPTEAAKAEGGLMRLGYEDGSKDAVTPQEMFPDNIDLDEIGPRKSKPKLRKMPQFKGKEVKKRKVAEAAEGGLMNLGGNEMDLRGGGFVPIGVAEKADDVPARLSKNEFVFTADAVRAAGGGSVDRGADLMYKTMKQLENQVA